MSAAQVPAVIGLKECLLALCAAVAALLIACSSGSGLGPDPTAEAEVTPPPPINIIPLGRTARSESAEITVHAVRISKEEGGERPPAGAEWLLADVAVRNVGSEPFSLIARLMDPYGDDYEHALPPIASRELLEPIEGETEVRGEIAFLVTDRGSGSTLIYGPDEEIWALQLGSIQLE